eukprot:TRINITY_DN482_c0_g2_i7.p1 TRINITY_DN482_c0_g2~~TRINITY_DN482_c0_g2_i7.p1  ORF type:complete len:386 (-),score=82.78 TRINITY_DN482_c0_g2_i7:1852-3009(-)
MVQSSQSVNHLKQWYQRRVRERNMQEMGWVALFYEGDTKPKKRWVRIQGDLLLLSKDESSTFSGEFLSLDVLQLDTTDLIGKEVIRLRKSQFVVFLDPLDEGADKFLVKLQRKSHSELKTRPRAPSLGVVRIPAATSPKLGSNTFYTLKVRVAEVKNICPKRAPSNGKYFTIVNCELEVKRTSTVVATNFNPLFAETFSLTTHDPENHPLVVSTWDADKDKLIGKVEIPLLPLLENPLLGDTWFPLKYSNSFVSGSIQLRIDMGIDCFNVVVMEATNLPVCHYMYKIYLCYGRQEMKSKPQKYNETLVWNESKSLYLFISFLPLPSPPSVFFRRFFSPIGDLNHEEGTPGTRVEKNGFGWKKKTGKNACKNGKIQKRFLVRKKKS